MNAILDSANATVEHDFQREFDHKYITSSEICKELSVTRVAVHTRRRNGLLPNAIAVLGSLLMIWDRKQIEPHLREWREQLDAKRGNMQ